MTSLKRPSQMNPDILLKRPRTDVAIYDRKKEMIISTNINDMPRTSCLFAPNIQMMGHKGEVYCGKFSPNGSLFTSAGFDHQVMFWSVLNDCKNIGILTGHSRPILDLAFSSDSEWLYTTGIDKTVIIWDTNSGEIVRRMKGHTKFVNSVSPVLNYKNLFCTGSDDAKLRLWDRRCKNTTHTMDTKYPILATSYSKDGQYIYSSGLENLISQWDSRQQSVVQSYRGHNDTVTGLAISPDGNWLLSNSRDNTLRVWDIRPYVAPGERNTSYRIMMGHSHDAERNLLRCAWTRDGRGVSAGSSERNVNIWDVHTSQAIYRLPGHTASVNEVAFHPTQPIVASVGSDSRILMGELESF